MLKSWNLFRILLSFDFDEVSINVYWQKQFSIIVVCMKCQNSTIPLHANILNNEKHKKRKRNCQLNNIKWLAQYSELIP